MKRSHLGAMLLCIFFACSYAFGQVATTSLRGLVKDQAGALVPGAKVTLLDKSVNKTFTAMSDGSGYYQFPQIPPAHYLITAEAGGFGKQSKTAELLVNQPATINFALSVEASNVTVDVSGSAQTLNTTDASEGNSIGNQMIQSIPSDGRDPISLLALQPGVLFLGEGGSQSATGNQENTDSRQGAVSGSRSDQGNITLDGLDDNSQINGYAFTGVLRSTLDSTEEFRVTTSDGSADEGRSSGAQVSLVTKSGTNHFHGAAYEYYRPTNTVSNNWFLKNSQLSAGMPNIPAKYLRNVFGAALGGPIKKDKLFFFGNYEGLRQAIDDVASATVPSVAFQNGTIMYQDAQGNNDTLSTANIASLDSGCTSSNFDGATVCPWGPGVNPNVLSYYKNVPVSTGSASGDGLNNGSLFFPVKIPTTQNTSILKLDYNMTSKQQLFVRGNYQKDTYAGDANLPGQPPSSVKVYNTKGLAIGHTWNPTPNIVNDLRYGYVRQSYGLSGIGSGQYVDFRFLTQPEAQTRNTINAVPVHNVVDNLTITKGNHTISVGVNWRLVQDINTTDAASFNVASTNPDWLVGSGAAPDPSSLGTNLPAVGSGFSQSYYIAYASILGTVPSLTNNYNYRVTSRTGGTLYPTGALIKQHYRANEYEGYVMDSWRVRPNLTVTAGLRYTLLSTPYEVHGQQVAPTINTHNWFKERGYAAAKGIISEPLISFAPAGKGNNAPGYWPENKNNFAPRFAVAWSPDSKTSIRAGAGMYFDHYGEALVQNFVSNGAFGLSTSLTNQANVLSYTGSNPSPRFTGEHNLPNIPLPAASQTTAFPYTPPAGSFLITFGVDNRLKTPYSYAYNLSFQRQLPWGLLFEEAYVGRFGRHLLQQLDLAEPVDWNDPQGGGDYFTAGAKLSKLVDEHHGAYYSTEYGASSGGATAPVSVPTIQYFEDVFPQMANFDFQGESATEAVYNNEWAVNRYGAGETSALADIDFYCVYGGYCANGTNKFWQSQFSSLYAWSSIGSSSYNALQASLRHPAAHGLSFDVSYTLSKSLDLNSGTERASEFSADLNGGSAIQNSWNPKLNKAVSDFDTRHLVNADLVYDLPVGRGKQLLGSANKAVDSLVGGWTFAGLYRWTSGLPFSLYEPGWTTDWQLEGFAVKTGYIKTHKHQVAGQEQVFANPGVIGANYQSNNGPVRLPYPGEPGSRNVFRGDGYFDIDTTLSKNWVLARYGTLKFDWEVFNVTNSNRFDTNSINAQVSSSTLGAYGATLPAASNFRRMQFGLRYDF